MTQFICLDLPLPQTPHDYLTVIEQALWSYGEPLRWAITVIHRDRQMMTIEAVVLPNSASEH